MWLFCPVLYYVIIHITLIQQPVFGLQLTLLLFFSLSVVHQFSQLINYRKKLGSDKFPVIDQTFYPNYKDMVRSDFLYVYVVSNPALNEHLSNLSTINKMSPLMILRLKYS